MVEKENIVELVCVGDRHVGKTFMIQSFIQDEVPSEDSTKSIYRQSKKVITVDGEEITLNIWDSAG